MLNFARRDILATKGAKQSIKGQVKTSPVGIS
jgi:hypothetical protein